MDGVEPTAAAGVRALAAWLHARRELSERLEVLLMHGPTAVERVARHLQELRDGYDRELAAFDAFTQGRGGDGVPCEPVRALSPGPAPAAHEPSPGQVRLEDYPPLRSVVLPP